MAPDLPSLFVTALGLGVYVLVWPVLAFWVGLAGLVRLDRFRAVPAVRNGARTAAFGAFVYVPALALFLAVARWRDDGAGVAVPEAGLAELAAYTLVFALFVAAVAGIGHLVADRSSSGAGRTATWSAALLVAFLVLSFWFTEGVQQCLGGPHWLIPRDVCP